MSMNTVAKLKTRSKLAFGLGASAEAIDIMGVA